MSIILDFPDNYTARPAQVEILARIDKAINAGKKYIIINAPTGIGKSLISKTLGNYSNNPSSSFIKCVKDYSIYGEDGPLIMDQEPHFGCFALTITKALQDQYKDSFSDTGVLKGKSNYQCAVDDELSVDVAPCIFEANLKNKCWSCNTCPYYNSRNDMLIKKFSTLNYSMFFSLPEHLKKRQVLVCDEGSELEEQLVSQFTCEIDIPFLVKNGILVSAFPTQETSTKIFAWINNITEQLDLTVKDLKNWLGKAEHRKDFIEFNKKKTLYTKITSLQQKITTLQGTYYEAQYLIEKIDSNIKFIPLKVDVLSKYLFDQVKTVVILSATIINHKNYAKSLGMKDYEYIEVETNFDPEKSPIYIMAKQKLNYKNLTSMLPTLKNQVEQILAEHKGEKGIIHTHTQYIADYIRENTKNKRLLFREKGVTNEDILDIHFNSDEPTVLVSPSMTYGVDLKGDYGKFQILLKAPWLPTKEIRVEKLMKMDKEWYSDQMLKTLVQACGRGVRSEDDECQTYILDGSIYDAILRNRHKLPKFFLDRFQ